VSEMAFQFKDGAQLRGDPQRVGQELEAIRGVAGGLTARAVVDAARPKKHYLHRYFTWDDAIAAARYREDEARHLIRSVVVRFTDEPTSTVPVRAFVAIGKDEDRYMPTSVVLSQEKLRAKLLARAVEELRWFKQKYRDLSELAGVFRAIETLDVPAKGQ
jgi:hypothetical protein